MSYYTGSRKDITRYTSKMNKPHKYDKCTMYYSIPLRNEYRTMVYSENKFGKLEDLEEEIDYPLIDLLNLIKNSNTKGIWYEHDGKLIYLKEVKLFYSSNNEWCLAGNGKLDNLCCIFSTPVKDYKKTWWLNKTKEE